mgnify:CR=1 FL=1
MSTQHEFVFNVPAAKIGREPMHFTFTADSKALRLLAKRYGIESVESLEGEVTLYREGDGVTIAANGSFTADVTQACVVTLEPVADHISETFEGWFLDESQAASFSRALKKKLEVEVGEMPLEDNEAPIGDERDEPDMVVNGNVEIGELVAQYLSLALNPYPHCPQARESGPMGEEEAKKPGPFAILKDLIKK